MRSEWRLRLERLVRLAILPKRGILVGVERVLEHLAGRLIQSAVERGKIDRDLGAGSGKPALAGTTLEAENHMAWQEIRNHAGNLADQNAD